MENKVIIRGEVRYIRMDKPPYLIRIHTEKNGYTDMPSIEFEEQWDIEIGDYITVLGELKKGYITRDNQITGSYMFVQGKEISYVNKSWDPLEGKDVNPLSENQFHLVGTVKEIHKEHDTLTVLHVLYNGEDLEISAFRNLAERALRFKEGDSIEVYGKIQTVRKQRKNGSYTNFEMPVAAFLTKERQKPAQATL